MIELPLKMAYRHVSGVTGERLKIHHCGWNYFHDVNFRLAEDLLLSMESVLAIIEDGRARLEKISS